MKENTLLRRMSMSKKLVKRMMACLLAVVMCLTMAVGNGMVALADEEGVVSGEGSEEETPEEGEPEEVPVLNGWVLTEEGWYYYEKGVAVVGWKKIGNTWYYMYEDGIMAADTWIGEYYVNAEGAWVESYRPAQWILSGNRWWYRNIDGSYPVGRWQQIDGEWYYFDRAGYMVTGWQQIGGVWYYLGADGSMRTGWQKDGGTWYYLNESGAMETGWILLGDTWYYLNRSGAMLTGWQQISGVWYYLGTDGSMVIGRQEIGKKAYYFETTGAMVTGWKELEEGWYYFDASGAMLKGWIKVGNTWYYCDKDSGVMYENQWLENKYYLFDEGAMAVGWQKIGEDWYYFDNNGVKQTSKWIGDYYVQADGTMAVSQYIGIEYVGEDGKKVPRSGSERVYEIDLGDGKKTIVIGYYDADMANDIYEAVNAYRTEKGLEILQPAVMPMKAQANIRAYEITYLFDKYTRPNGDKSTSIYPGVFDENIARSCTSATEVMNQWKQSVDTNKIMLSNDAKFSAVSVFKLKTGNTYTNYIVQLFSK